MCNCDVLARIQTDYHTVICSVCSEETRYFGFLNVENSSYNQSHCPFSKGYCRKKRFKDMLENLFYPCCSHLDNSVLSQLHGKKILNTEQIFEELKLMRIKDKRYGSIHLMTKLFCKEYIYLDPPSRDLIDYMCKFFEEIELLYIRMYPDTQFFNYSWLILKMLYIFELQPFAVYVKPLKCKKRIKWYSTKFDDIVSELSSLNIFPGFPGDFVNFPL